VGCLPVICTTHVGGAGGMNPPLMDACMCVQALHKQRQAGLKTAHKGTWEHVLRFKRNTHTCGTPGLCFRSTHTGAPAWGHWAARLPQPLLQTPAPAPPPMAAGPPGGPLGAAYARPGSCVHACNARQAGKARCAQPGSWVRAEQSNPGATEGAHAWDAWDAWETWNAWDAWDAR